jgi:hypothetical protein
MTQIIDTVGGWFPFVLLTFAAGGCLLAAAVALTGRHIPDVDEAARGFNCPVCDDRQPEADCECSGDCGRRGCPWLLLNTLNGPDDAFNAAIARLHADLNTGGDRDA